MSLEEQNRMLYILHRNGVSIKNIIFIMNDLNRSEIFDESQGQIELIDDWEFIEEEADWEFSDALDDDKINAIKNIQKKKREFNDTQRTQYALDQEQRVLDKQQELISKGIVEPNVSTFKISYGVTTKITTRYGRSPLHEAIFMRDIRLVEKYLKSGKFLDKIDNNGHTPLQMAYYENYKEALILFEAYDKKKVKKKKVKKVKKKTKKKTKKKKVKKKTKKKTKKKVVKKKVKKKTKKTKKGKKKTKKKKVVRKKTKKKKKSRQ